MTPVMEPKTDGVEKKKRSPRPKKVIAKRKIVNPALTKSIKKASGEMLAMTKTMDAVNLATPIPHHIELTEHQHNQLFTKISKTIEILVSMTDCIDRIEQKANK